MAVQMLFMHTETFLSTEQPKGVSLENLCLKSDMKSDTKQNLMSHSLLARLEEIGML